MAFRSALRPLNLVTRSSITGTRGFHSSRPAFVKVGDSIPPLELTEGSPANKVNLAKELSSADGLIIGVPGAFSRSSQASGSSQEAGAVTDRNSQARDALKNTSPATSLTLASETLAKSSLLL